MAGQSDKVTAVIREATCRRCWWREGRACYNDKLLRAGGVNKIPRKVEGDDRNGMELTEALWDACPTISKAVPSSLPTSTGAHQ